MEKKKLNKEQLMELYSDYLLSNGKRPVNVYVFMKDNKAEESDFYQHFSGFEAIENEYLKHFFKKSLELTGKIKGFKAFTAKEKLLNFYYIFFENLNLNRSLVLQLIGQKREFAGLKRIGTLKTLHRDFLKSIEFEQLPLMDKATGKVKDFGDKSREEVLWLHFLSVIDFWKNDQSPEFESTDVFIEKTIDTGFDLVYSSPLNKILDVGKFLWKERFQSSI